ncbi:MAG: acyl-CoA thioesterase [Rhodospirillales bacterium]|nr:acyl-CoA thioesterase [Rhodospirillales bacterium]
MEAAPFTVELPIRFSHTDPAGIVYFPNYFDFCNGVIEDWYTRGLGIDYARMIFEERRSAPIVHAECDFYAPSLMGDRVSFTLLLAKIGRTSIDMEIYGHVAGTLRLKANIVTVFMDLDTRKAVALPDAMRQKFEAYRKACEGWNPPPKPGA